jgi:hypothetical protein
MRAEGMFRRPGAAAVLLFGTLVLGACDYIVTPADESTPTPVTAGVWTAIATAVSQTESGDLHVDLAIENQTGDWSAMKVASTGAVSLKTGDGSSKACGTAFVGTGGTYLAPGFRMRGYTGGTKQEPKTQLLNVECAGAAPAAGSRLVIDYTYVSGEFNYYSPAGPTSGSLEVDLDKVDGALTYPIAQDVPDLVQGADAPIEAINEVALSLTAVTRTADGLELAWHTQNPTEYPTYVHIGAPVIGSDGVIYGFYESPHLVDTPITPAAESADWTTTVAVPADVTGLYILATVEAKQQKNFVGHAIDITSN